MSRGIPILLALLLTACGHAGAGYGSATDDQVRHIQEDEAVLARADTLAARTESSCDERCASLDDAGAASQRICETAAHVVDTDVQTRCERGRSTLQNTEFMILNACSCAGHARPPSESHE